MTRRLRRLPATLAEAAPPVDARVLERAAVCARIEALLETGTSVAAAVDALRERDTGLPSAATLRRWHAAWSGAGRDASALADGRHGRQRKPYGWEARAIEHWKNPAKPAYATVALWLRDDGFPSATASRVRRYLQSLPASVGGRDAPARTGAHWHRQNVTPHVIRDASVVPAGLIYEGDGHAGKTYVAHPSTGRPWRPEHIVWIDIRTHFVPGFWLAEAESAIAVMNSLSKVFLAHDHVPGLVHSDPGSGFVNHLLDDETTGWLGRLGVAALPGRPGNPRGQGLIEGWWRWFEERCGKRFETWGGECRTDRALQALEKKAARGEVRLPSVAEYAAAVAAYIDGYNATPQKGLGAETPRALWEAHLERSPLEVPEAVLRRPAAPGHVDRGGVRLFNRLYRAPELRMLDNRTPVTIEYDLTDASRVWVLWRDRRLCEAAEVRKRTWLPASRVEELAAKRAAGQRKRLARKLDEAEARARPVIDGAAAAEAAAIAAPDAPALPAPDDIDPFDVLP